MTTETALSFWVPTLGGQSLSSNAKNAKRNPLAIARAKDALSDAAYFAALSAFGPMTAEPRFKRVDILLDYHICYRKRPGDGMYRFTDPPNGGGDVAKPIVDYGLVKTRVIEDDSYHFVRVFSTTITPVETLAEEGVAVTVREVSDA